jgi:hypothetical protein
MTDPTQSAMVAADPRPLRDCLRCGHQWRQQWLDHTPKWCPQCGSAAWDSPPRLNTARRPTDAPNPRWKKRAQPRTLLRPQPGIRVVARPQVAQPESANARMLPPPPPKASMLPPPPAPMPQFAPQEEQPERTVQAPIFMQEDLQKLEKDMVRILGVTPSPQPLPELPPPEPEPEPPAIFAEGDSTSANALAPSIRTNTDESPEEN